VLHELGTLLQENDNQKIEALIATAKIHNQWFTSENIRKSIEAISTQFLTSDRLTPWANQYNIKEDSNQIIGVVMAGNIPMVGFHDMLCSFIAGHKTMLKCSSKDDILIPGLIELMKEIDPRTAKYFEKVDRLKGFDAVVATGGDTAAVHFEYYFSKYPHIIRKNRSSVAILDGSETPEELRELGADIFDYFGLGCRSVSKLYIPRDFNTDGLFEAFYHYKEVINHNKYKNNFDYNHAIYVLTLEPFLTNDFIILREDPALASRIACLHFERYDELEQATQDLASIKDQLQCVSSKNVISDWDHIALGQCQKPGMNDYADYVDTMQFLTQL
jgi:hypothetical protein